MSDSKDNFTDILKYLTCKGIQENDEAVIKWNKYANDVKQTKEILEWLPLKLSHNVMVPLGSKALMPGKLVHTNELLVNIGDTWFVKKSASQTISVCDRRLKICEEMLQKLDKERQLIFDKSLVPFQEDAFGAQERPEIIEKVTIEEDEEWRKQHKIKVKEYHQQLSELRKKEKKQIETEEDLWKHLDELELQEELEDELRRLQGDEDEGEDEDEETDEDEESIESEVDETVTVQEDIFNKTEPSNQLSVENIEKPLLTEKNSHRVNFTIDESSNDPLILKFKHSENVPIPTESEESSLMSPADIYNSYLHSLKSIQPVSILKKNINPNKDIETKALFMSENEQNMDSTITYSVSPGVILSDIVERNSVVPNVNIGNQPKKMSKFKASRMKK